MNQDNSNVFVENTDSTGTSKNRADYITCGRCGADMKKEARYCMKCGNLNYLNEENAFMKQYAINDIKQGNYISGLENAKNNGLDVPKDVVNHPYRKCLITNIILHLIPIVLIIILAVVLGGEFPVAAIIGCVVFCVILFIEAYSWQRMVIKAGERWWSYFVPGYSMYVFFKIALGNGWLFLIMCIPGIGGILSLVAFYKLGKKFYKNGWLTLFFPFIMIPIIGFGKHTEYRLTEQKTTQTLSSPTVDSKGRTQVERNYRRKKAILTCAVLVGIVFVVWLCWDYVLMAWDFLLKQLEETKDILQS